MKRAIASLALLMIMSACPDEPNSDEGSGTMTGDETTSGHGDEHDRSVTHRQTLPPSAARIEPRDAPELASDHALVIEQTRTGLLEYAHLEPVLMVDSLCFDGQPPAGDPAWACTTTAWRERHELVLSFAAPG